MVEEPFNRVGAGPVGPAGGPAVVTDEDAEHGIAEGADFCGGGQGIHRLVSFRGVAMGEIQRKPRSEFSSDASPGRKGFMGCLSYRSR